MEIILIILCNEDVCVRWERLGECVSMREWGKVRYIRNIFLLLFVVVFSFFSVIYGFVLCVIINLYRVYNMTLCQKLSPKPMAFVSMPSVPVTVCRHYCLCASRFRASLLLSYDFCSRVNLRVRFLRVKFVCFYMLVGVLHICILS